MGFIHDLVIFGFRSDEARILVDDNVSILPIGPSNQSLHTIDALTSILQARRQRSRLMRSFTQPLKEPPSKESLNKEPTALNGKQGLK